MDGFSIRITRRDGDAEQTIEIGSLAAPKPQVINVGAIDITADAGKPPTFHSAAELADWLDSLHESDATGAVGNRKWPAAQRAATAIRTASELEWSDTLCNGERVNHAKAEAACAALGDGWRLPTRIELESILDLTRHEPAIDTDRFPDTKSGAYWSSTPCAWSSGYAWVVLFDGGLVNYYRRDDFNAFVRAVRSVPAGQ